MGTKPWEWDNTVVKGTIPDLRTCVFHMCVIVLHLRKADHLNLVQCMDS